jgi:Asp-tRNA(Asn)/Glu-tRNA(Gln) amidotransferase A subunit family amidase
MSDDELAFEPAYKLLRLIAEREISPVELTRMYLDRIERLDPQLNSFLTVTEDEAMAAAKNAEEMLSRGGALGALHGLPLAIKDTQRTKGIRTTLGSLPFKDQIPERDATVVERVRAAGAIVLGKTNAPELGIVGTCENRLGEPGRNPWNTDCTPGGSTGGGAAALAASLCPLATGSDGGGSIRIPAHFCGIYGLKPTQGRVSGFTGTEGAPMPYIFSQNGPIGRTVRDAALLLDVMAGHDPNDPVSLRETPPDFVGALDREIKGLRVAWSPDFGFADVDGEVQLVTSAAAKLFEQLGCHVQESALAMDPPYDAFGYLGAADTYSTLGSLLDTHREQLTEYAVFWLEYGATVTAGDYAAALGRIDRLRARMDDLFEEFDLLLSPTACFPAFPYGEFPGQWSPGLAFPDQYWNGAFTLPINAIGHAAASIPAGFSTEGLPIGLQIVGRKGDEETVLAASAAFEEAQPWIQHRPPVS